MGGKISDTIIIQMNNFGRIVNCGAISQYNADSPQVTFFTFISHINLYQTSPSFYTKFIASRLKMQGLILFDYAPRFGEAMQALQGWVRDGKIVHKDHVIDGLENAPEALKNLFENKYFGKLLIRVNSDDEVPNSKL